MPALLTSPTAALSRWPHVVPPSAKQWTVAEFHASAAAGVWADRRPFLLRGTVWEQGTMNPTHAGLLNLVNAALLPILPPDTYVRVQQPLSLNRTTDPMPDIAVVAGQMRDHLVVHPTTAILVVEVSDTTLFFDLTSKAEAYAEAGLPEYWVIDANAGQLLVFRDPVAIPAGGHTYHTRLTLSPTDIVTPLAAPNQPVRVADLLP